MLRHDYNPIRARMLWVGVINTVAAGLVMAGLGAEVINGWAAWGIGALDLLVMAGVLVRGTQKSELRTTPLDEAGQPINPAYTSRDPS